MLTLTKAIGLIILVSLLTFANGCGRNCRELSDEQWLTLQSDMQQERAEVGHQRDLLEADRREWDERERTDPIIAQGISAAALLICCSLPLLVISLLLGSRRSDDAEAAHELIVEDWIKHSRHDSPKNRLETKR